MTKEFYSERDLDALGLYSKAHRDRLIKAGRFPAPIKLGDRGSKRFYPKEQIDALKSRAGKSAEAASA
jgi:predicted DNA-binding transcriptional regulator AlpA